MTALLVISLLAACRTVEGDRILGSDLAAASPAFTALDPNAVIGFAPRAGVQRVLRAGELARIAKQHGIAVPNALGEVCFDRVTERLTEEKLRSVLQKALPEARIEILDFPRYPVPSGGLDFPRAGLSVPPLASPDSPVVWRGRVVNEGRSTPVWARVRVTMERTWVEAVAELAAGQPIDAARLRVRSGQQFPLRHAPLASIEDVAGRKALRAITAGQPIFRSMLVASPDIEHGETVEVEVASGAARLAFEARAESSGRIGESVVVRNPANARIFRGRIEAKGKVLVAVEANKR